MVEKQMGKSKNIFISFSLPSRVMSAASRLMKDLKELQHQQEIDPLYNIAAHPLNESIFVWHANLVGPVDTPYEDGVFHMEITFSEDYPMTAPSVRILNSMPHPHVIDDRICLDLLQDYESFFDSESDDYNRTQGTGWSSAYSVHTLLIQMQTFLVNFDDCSHLNDKQISTILRAIPKAIENAKTYNCPDCKHSPDTVWPTVFVSQPEKLFSSDSEIEVSEDSSDDIISPPKQNITEKITCFHTKQDHTETIIGLGIRKKTQPGNNFIASLNSCFDYISFDAYKGGVRHDASNNPFTHWIPLYINEDHGNRALPILKQAMGYIATDKIQSSFTPEWIVMILPKLLSSLTVDVMSDEVHKSMRALTTYCAFHRLFLLLVEKYPTIIEYIDKKIENFIKNEVHRTKKAISSLGEFLPLLTISNYTWDDVAPAYLTESLDRSVRWYLAKFPQLRYTNDPTVETQRTELSFKGSTIGLRVLVFHVKFIDLIACPSGKSLSDIAREYDSRLGMPSAQQKRDLTQLTAKAGGIASWAELFEQIRLPKPSEKELRKLLQQAVVNSKKKKYHFNSMCTRFQKGKCKFHDGCKFNHVHNPRAGPPRSSNPKRKNKAKPK